MDKTQLTDIDIRNFQIIRERKDLYIVNWNRAAYDLVFSPHDRGWYLKRYPQQDTSALHETKLSALLELLTGQCSWED